jgi:hypothetical protein
VTPPRWDIAQENSALIVVDMQNGFLRPDGFFAKGGLDWPRCASTIEPSRRVLAAARAAAVPIFFTRYTLQPDYSDAGLLALWRPRLKEVGAMVRGTRDWKIADGNHAGRRTLSSSIAVGEGIELFDIAEGMSRLLLDPSAQSCLERAVTELERSGR